MTTDIEDINKLSRGDETMSNNSVGTKRSCENNDKSTKKHKKFKKKKKSKNAPLVIPEETSEQPQELETAENEVPSNEESLKKKKKKKKVKTEDQEEQEEGEKGEESEDGTKRKKPSKRQLKREKAEIRAAEAKEVGKQGNAQKALNYVSMWKHARSEWKFNKIRQIFLIDNLLNENYIPEEHFSTVLEYFEGCKGMARKQLLDKAMAVIKKIEDKVKEDDKEEVVETTEYKRARQLMQALPTE